MLSTLKHGLFSYPILQAADILVHRATHVPVGEDQRQHLEFARECVTNFNHAYGGQYLVSPETILCMCFLSLSSFPTPLLSPTPCAQQLQPTNHHPAPTKRVMSLKTPLTKMSKSDADPASRILLTDTASETSLKIKRAVTDSTNSITYDPSARPGVANLLRLLSHFDTAQRTPEQLAGELGSDGASLKVLKERVAVR